MNLKLIDGICDSASSHLAKRVAGFIPLRNGIYDTIPYVGQIFSNTSKLCFFLHQPVTMGKQ